MMSDHLEPSGTPNTIKRAWKTPVLHTRGVEETLSAAEFSDTETADYAPGTPGAS